MKVLLLGGGGREHAMAWKISQSPLCETLFIAPGNAGTALFGKNASIDILDFDAVGRFALENHVDMLVVGPEEPLVKGIADFFAKDARLKDMMFIGPQSGGARLEGSKAFAKSFMEKHHIPTAAYQSFHSDQVEEGVNFIMKRLPPFVLKADGLAAGKGVVISNDTREAVRTLREMLGGKLFGEAARTVVVEEFLPGVELSVFVLTDGETYCMLPSAKDYKRVGEHDTGSNTGGMGAVSPVPFADEKIMERIEKRVVEPTIRGIKADKIPYCGFLFFGLMIVDGYPLVIEYNARLGDPEAEVILPRLRSDLLEMMQLCCTNRLHAYTANISPQTALTLMLCSGGYPGPYQKGMVISGLDNQRETRLFYAGVKQKGDQLLTNGGRVMAITATAQNLEMARSIAYKSATKIDFKGKYYRRDIGVDLIKLKPGNL